MESGITINILVIINNASCPFFVSQNSAETCYGKSPVKQMVWKA